MFQIDRVSVTSTDSYHRGSYCLARVFQNLPAPPKHFGISDVFLFCKVFSQPENLGSHLAMSPDDRFLAQGKESFPKICQVRPMPNLNFHTNYPPSDIQRQMEQFISSQKLGLLTPLANFTQMM